MDTDLTPAKAALADLTSAELHALIAAPERRTANGIGLARVDRGRVRLGVEPVRRSRLRAAAAEAAIDPSEDAVSIDAAIAMRPSFAQDCAAVRALFDALVD